MHTPWVEAARFLSRSRQPLPQQIADQLRRQIVRGELRIGQKLPSIRKLAGLYGVSIPTMGAAVHVLVSLGLVRTSHGIGTFVTGPGHRASLLNYAWREASLRELAIVRSAIDERAPALFANRMRTSRIAVPTSAVSDLNFFAVERSAQRRGAADRFVTADLAFHRAMLDGLKGIEIGRVLYERIGERLRPTLEAAGGEMAEAEELDLAHRALAHAVAEGDLPRAVRTSRFVARCELQSTSTALG